MIRRSAVGLVALGLFIAMSASAGESRQLAPEERDTAFAISEHFADCAGVFDGVAAVPSNPAPTDAKSIALHERANGAVVAGAWLLFSVALVPSWKNAHDFVKERASAQKNIWLARLSPSGDQSHSSALEWLKQAGKEMQECTDTLGETQSQFVSQFRRWRYSHESDNR